MTSLLDSERALRLMRKASAVDEACRFAELATSDCEPTCREAVTLAATELAENLLKYAESGGELFAGTIGIRVTSDEVSIRSTNPVSADDDARHVIDLVNQIRQSPGGARVLYRERLRELFETPSMPRAQLGLLRIAYEGEFSLSAQFQRPVLEVIATRSSRGES